MIKSNSKDNISQPYLSVGRYYFLSCIKFYISKISTSIFAMNLKLEILSKKNSELRISDFTFSFISIKKIKYLLNY